MSMGTGLPGDRVGCAYCVGLDIGLEGVRVGGCGTDVAGCAVLKDAWKALSAVWSGPSEWPG